MLWTIAFDSPYGILRHLMDHPTSKNAWESLLKIEGQGQARDFPTWSTDSMITLIEDLQIRDQLNQLPHLRWTIPLIEDPHAGIKPCWEPLCWLTKIFKQGSNPPPLFYVEESEIAYTRETREFRQERFAKTFTDSILKSRSLLQHPCFQSESYTIMESWNGIGNPFSHKGRWLIMTYENISRCDKHPINMYET